MIGCAEIGDGDHLPCVAGEFDEFGDHARAGQVEGGVDAAEPAHPVGPALAVGGGEGPQAPQVVLVAGAGSADHADAAVAGDLQDGRADAAGRAADQQGLSRADAHLAQDPQRGLDHRGVAGGLLEGEALGHRRPGRQYGELGVGVDAFAEHMVPDPRAADALADPVDDPGGVQAQSGGQSGGVGAEDLAFADPPVDGVHARRADGYADLTGPRAGLVGVEEVQDVGIAELGEDHLLHTDDHNTNR